MSHQPHDVRILQNSNVTPLLFHRVATRLNWNGFVLVILSMACLSFSMPAFSLVIAEQNQSVELSISFLRDRMDEFHNRFPIYDDVSSAGNHFPAFGAVNRPQNVDNPNGSWTDNPHSGATCVRFSFTPSNPEDYGGYYMMNGILPKGKTIPELNWGNVPNAGLNIMGATRLTFFARGQNGGEKIEFLFGGVGRNSDTGVPFYPYPDSAKKKAIKVTLSNLWQQYSIDLTGLDTSYVLGGFAWVANAPDNPNPLGTVFFVDDINIELNANALQNRLAQPRFLRSFLTAPLQSNPFDNNNDDDVDLTLRNTAFTYDNALALLAFLAHGTDDSVRRARLIGDAFVYAAGHDRYFTDGRIRTDYAAGDIAVSPGWTPNNRIGTVPIPGYYYEYAPNKGFYEVEQDSVDTGNNAWAMIAMLKLYQKTNDTRYLETSRRIGNFIHSQRNDSTTATYRGFLGGIMKPEDITPIPRTYAGVEHNLDIAAAFSVMYSLTGETVWLNDATHAMEFVDAMFDSSKGCYLAGSKTPNDRNANPWQLPVDVQAWSILALRSSIASRHAALLSCVENNHYVTADGFSGFDFNNDKDAVWFEGTSQVAVAYALTGYNDKSDLLRATLRQAQSMEVYGEAKGVSASSRNGLTTGFNSGAKPADQCDSKPETCTFKYFRRQHLGATAWNVFAQLDFNPYFDRFDSYSLTVTNDNKLNGTVTSDKGGINCGAICIQDYSNGSVVTLSATAADGYSFTGWSGDCAGLGTCLVSINANKRVTANFVKISSFPVIVTNQNMQGGLISGSGIECGASCSNIVDGKVVIGLCKISSICTQTFPDGTSVTLTATPANSVVDYEFKGWGGDCANSSGSSCTLVVNAAKSVTASFKSIVHEQTIVFGNPPSMVVGGTGTVTATGGGSGQPVKFTSKTDKICSVTTDGKVVTGKAAGLCTIAANQDGYINYLPAKEAIQSFYVAGATFAYIPDRLSVAVYDMATMTRVATIPSAGNCSACFSSSVKGIAVMLDGTRVFTSNSDTKSVSVIDTANNIVMASISVGDNPNGIAVNAAGTRVYVANSSSNNVSVIDTGNNTVIATVPVGIYPEDIAVNASGSRVYVVNSQSNNVSVIDTSTNSVVATVAVDNTSNISGNRITITPNDQRVYVTNNVSKSVSIIDTSCNCVSKTLSLSGSPHGIAINPAGTRAYITLDYGISIFDTVTDANLVNISFNGYPQGIAFNAEGTKAYLSTQGSNTNTLSVFDTVNNAIVTSAVVDGHNTFSRFIAQVPNPSPQVIYFDPLPNQSLDAASFQLSALASSGLSVSYSSTTPTTCSLSGNSVSLLSTGICTIKASQAGNVIYAPAQSIQQSFNISNGMASQTATYAYLGDYYSNKVYVLDMAGGGLVKTLTVGSRPVGFAASQDGKRMYVTNAYSGNISVIDTATQSIVATLSVGKYPQGVSLNATGSRAYVANSDSSDMTILDLVNNKTLATVPIASGYPLGVAINPNDTRVYVTSHYNGRVSVIDTTSNSVIATIAVGSYPKGLAVNPAGTRVYVANSDPGSISVIDTATNTVVANIKIGGYVNSVTFEPTGKRAYVTKGDSGTVVVLDTTTNTILTHVAVGGWPYGIALNSDGTRAHVTVGNRVVAFDMASNITASIATVPFGNLDSFGQFIAQVSCPCEQTISFDSPANLTYAASPFTLDAKASSALPVEFTSSTPGVCEVNGNQVTMLAIGTCTIEASQPGSVAYKPATPVKRSITLGKGNQEIVCEPAPVVKVGGSGNLNCRGGTSGNPVTIISTTPAVCTTSGTNGITMTGETAGQCAIVANQAGNDNYNPALSFPLSFPILKADQTIAFGMPPALIVGGTETVSATGGASGNSVTLDTQTAGTCTLSNIVSNDPTTTATVTGKAAGTCTLAANQAGIDNYLPAPTVLQSFTVTAMSKLTVQIGNKAYGTVTGGGIACGDTCSVTMDIGSTVNLTAAPISNDYQFTGWGGACQGYGNVCTVTMDTDKTVTANFDVFKKKHRSAWRKLLGQWPN